MIEEDDVAGAESALPVANGEDFGAVFGGVVEDDRPGDNAGMFEPATIVITLTDAAKTFAYRGLRVLAERIARVADRIGPSR